MKKLLLPLILAFLCSNSFAQYPDLIISEYVEGSSNNKYIEIYNGTGASVNLADYELRLYANGSAIPSITTVLSGTLSDDSTIVYRNAAATIYGGASTAASAVGFNGDDAIAIYNTVTTSFADIFGNIGCDPGVEWISTNTTLNRTLVRKATVCAGVTVDPGTSCPFPTLDSEWTQFNQDDISNLGSHSACFGQATNCTGDSILLVLSGFRGSIQWQESSDLIVWSNIVGATSDTELVILDSTTWYRAEVIEGTCLPIYSGIKQYVVADCFTCGIDSIQDADGNWYQTVQIGSRCWTKENMRTTKYPDGSPITKGNITHGDAGWGTDQAWYSCPPNASNNGEDCVAAASLGMMYQWNAAMDGSTVEGAQGVCPTSWHVPSDMEWKTLEGQLGMSVAQQDITGWRGTNEGSKMADHIADQNWPADALTGDVGFASSGFDLGASGCRSTNGNYFNRTVYSYVWSSTWSGVSASNRRLYYTFTTVFSSPDSKAYGFSVRCIKDCPLPATPGPVNGSTKVDTGQMGVTYTIDTVSGASSYSWTVPAGATIAFGQGTDSIVVNFGSTFGNVCVTANNSCGASPTSCLGVTVFTCGTDSVQDVEGNWYQTIQVGTQCWFKENIRTTTYPDGSVITKGPSTHGALGWTVDSAYYSCPPNASNNGEDCAAAASLGMAYQWSAVMDGATIEGAQGVCPTSWHIPTDAEWCTLENTIEAGTDASCNTTGYRGTSTGSRMANDGSGHIWIAGNLRSDANFGTSGFEILPAGYRDVNGQYLGRTNAIYSWTSTESGSSATRRYFNYSFRGVFRGDIGKPYCFTVRCIKD